MVAPNTLGLDDDLDSVELLIAIERAFNIKIPDQDAATASTMGDLHDIVASKLEDTGGEKCRTSMAFYRVRRALKMVLGEVDIRPDTSLSAIWGRSPKLLWAQAQRHCELRLPPLSQTNISGFGGLLIAAAIFGVPILWIAKITGWLVLALVVGLTAAGFVLTRLDPLAFGPIATVGDLAQRTASQNYGVLVSLGGRSDTKAIWDALVEVAGAFSENLPAEKIERTTVILQSQYEKARARA
ncbi:hypothetical protein [Candidatus Viadribacter manganicus]|uniref:Carrier domain-containing protein n=1 Tax=Candidatus Viadribacter manganicus TaxID=1759059 RepID=A0A1B1AD47_9PROT|nr:hypothetical protein [Candidatus Viadribacter manganicus]ANP44485.1 hypothetical protein ATE48_00380 [Candidatus Viadribacter manganicus]